MLFNPLMRASAVKVGDVIAHRAKKIFPAEDQHVIQTFAPHATQKAFTLRIRTRHLIRNLQHRDAGVLCHAIKRGAEFRVMIAQDEFGMYAVGCSFTELLGDPFSRWMPRDSQMHDAARRKFNNEEEKMVRTARSMTGKK